MPKVVIDDISIEIDAGYTVLQAAQMIDTEIPVFCYHPKLAIAGNCRMCLVEVENIPKLVASCAMPIHDGMVIHTKSDKVKKSRKNVLEFLLKNHPLDCPICDQGGECDLQDITMAYGSSYSRFDGPKRVVSQSYMGPLIRPYMTRCIQCTRCVRFGADIAGMQELGAIGRGETMEIVSFLDQAIYSELSGNLVDVCPVGALTSKPYQFQGRPWELKKTNSIDVLDAVGSNIRIDSYNLQVKRILPRLNEAINEEWISDKTRYAFDGTMIQRLDQPYLKVNGKLQIANWDQALINTAENLKKFKSDEIAVLIGDLVDCETIFAMKKLCIALGITQYDCRLNDEPLHPCNGHASYLFNTTIAGIEQSDFCLIVGANVRADAALVHARLRKRYLKGNFKVAYLGGNLGKDRDFCFAYENLGNNISVLNQIAKGQHDLCDALKRAKNPMIIIGEAALSHQESNSIYQTVIQIAERHNVIKSNWNGFNILHTAASRVGALDLEFVPPDNTTTVSTILSAAQLGKIKALYLVGVDQLNFEQLKDTFIIYQGHHGGAGAQYANVILPGCSYIEKDAFYINMEGRLQQACQAITPPGQAKEDWKIIRALSNYLGANLTFNTIDQLHQQIFEMYPHFKVQDQIRLAPWLSTVSNKNIPLKGFFDPETFNFYQRDIISQHSPIMARCINPSSQSYPGSR